MLKLIHNKEVVWELILSVLTGERSENDPLFVSWLEESEENRKLFQSLVEEKGEGEFSVEANFSRLTTALEMKPKRKYFPYWLRYTAVLLGIILLSTLAYFGTQNTHTAYQASVSSKSTLEPGSKKALLIMDDGRTINLNESFSLREKDGLTIANDSTQGLSYQKEGQVKRKKPDYHVIEVPVGGEYDLKLADGTTVYLNSASSLKFPSFFDGDSRKVELTGEAYFDVAKSSTPFIVQTNTIEIQVLGTSFNVSAYETDRKVSTTLLTGSVQLKPKFSNETYSLSPGYCLDFNKDTREMAKLKVNTEASTAWVRGEFYFENQSLEEILTKLSRWYSFSTDYQQADIKNMRFTGGAEKKRPLRYLLNQIETITNIKFIEDGNTIKAYK